MWKMAAPDFDLDLNLHRASSTKAHTECVWKHGSMTEKKTLDSGKSHTAGGTSAMASFALAILDTRTAGTCQGSATPRPAGAPLTEPVRPQNAFLI